MTELTLGRASEPLVAVPTRTAATTRLGRSAVDALGLRDRAILPGPGGGPDAFGLGLPDGNRSVIVPERTIGFGGLGWALSVKGAGALAPLYGRTPLDGAAVDAARGFWGESWFGEAPWGAQGEAGLAIAREVTDLADEHRLHGFAICPSLQWVELPSAIVEEAASRFWYRRHRGRFLQEHRLVPSDVRLFHASDATLGQTPQTVLSRFGVRDPVALDGFLERLLASGFAALTLYPRSLREGAWGLEGLDYASVWLDKDSVVAPDGTLCFADLEGLDWECCGRDWPFETRVRVQFDRNFYEVMYGVHVLLCERERMTGEPLSSYERRAVLATRIELALADDPVLECARRAEGLDLVVRSPLLPRERVTIRILDLR